MITVVCEISTVGTIALNLSRERPNVSTLGERLRVAV